MRSNMKLLENIPEKKMLLTNDLGFEKSNGYIIKTQKNEGDDIKIQLEDID